MYALEIVFLLVLSRHVTSQGIATFSVVPQWRCPKETGNCVRERPGVRTTLSLKNGSSVERQSECLKKCLAHPGAEGCEMSWQDLDEATCYVHTDTIKTINSTNGDAICWIFLKCRGGLPMFLGNFESTNRRRKRDRYIHVSYKKKQRRDQATEYELKSVGGTQCTLYQTKDVTRLRGGANCSAAFDDARFIRNGLYTSQGEFYKRVGLEFVGTWAIDYPQFSYNYEFTQSGVVAVTRRQHQQRSVLTVSDDTTMFPPSQGWFKIENSHDINIVEYVRVRDPITLESRLFCVAGKLPVNRKIGCGGSYGDFSHYCCQGNGVKQRWSLQERNVCFGGVQSGDKGVELGEKTGGEQGTSKVGTFTMKYSGPFNSMKLTHKSGVIVCGKVTSNWGCGDTSSISISVDREEGGEDFIPDRWREDFIPDRWRRGTTASIFPRARFRDNEAMTSKELILVGRAIEVKEDTRMMVWKDDDEMYNDIRTCVDVYSKITAPLFQQRRGGDVILKVSFTLTDEWRDELYDATNLDYFNYKRKLLDEVGVYFNDTVSTRLSSLSYLSVSEIRKSESRLVDIDLTINKPALCPTFAKAAPNIKLKSFSIVGGRVNVTNIGCCSREVIGEESYKGRYVFTETPIFEEVTLPCKYDQNVSLTRECFFNDDNEHGGSAEWRRPDMKICPPKSKTTSRLDKLNITTASHQRRMTSTDKIDTAETLNEIIPDASYVTTPKDLTYISDITSMLVVGGDESYETDSQVANLTENVLSTFSTLLDTPDAIVAEAEKTDTTATSLLRDMEKFAATLASYMTPTRTNVTMSRKNIGLQVAKVQKQDIEVFSHLQNTDEVSVGIDNRNKKINSDFLASLYIPRSAFDSNDVIVSSQAYLRSTLFVDKEQMKMIEGENISFQNPVQSLVLSISIGRSVSSLVDPVTLRFKKRHLLGYNSTCSYWEFGNGTRTGRWSSTGCMFINETLDGIVTCQCYHLTNFAILMDVYQTGSNPLALSIITSIGCFLSLLGLVITIVVFSSFRKLREKQPSKILLCLCVSLVVFLVIFLVGAERPEPRVPCQIIAGLLHYFLMTSFAWMLVTAVNLFQLLVLVFRRSDEERFFKIVSFLAWGVPIVIVVTTALVRPHELGNEYFCFPQRSAAYFGVILPIAIVLLVNFIVLGSIMVKFSRNRPLGEAKEHKKNLNQTRIAVSVTILLGLTWILAVFAINGAQFIFQLLFCIFNSLQGFFIFVLHTLTNKAVQKEIRNFLRTKFGLFDATKEETTTLSTGTQVPLKTLRGGKNSSLDNDGEEGEKRKLRKCVVVCY